MSMLSRYFSQVRTRAQVRRWLSALSDPCATAARSLFLLNRHARDCSPDRPAIYALKQAMLRHLCTTRPYAARPQMQKRYCRRCDGSGVHWRGEPCFACNGTGVYSETDLVLFQFEIGGIPYSWHQIKAYIDWPVQFSERPHAEWVDYAPCGSILPDAHRDVLTWTVYEYLQSAGATLPPFPGLRPAFVLRFYAARLLPTAALGRLARWLDRHNFHIPAWLARIAADELIPF